MNAQELLTAPASTLTRKQRRDRAALKRQIADQMRFLPGYAVGRVRTTVDGVRIRPRPEQWGATITIPTADLQLP